MSPVVIAIAMFGAMLGLLITGRHIPFIVGGVGTIALILLWGTGSLDMAYFITQGILNWHMLVAIPMFVFMGYILSRSGMADKLFHAMHLWMGGIHGGLGMGTIAMCALVAAMSGAMIAATVTAGTIALPAMLKRKYNKLMVTGLVQAGGSLGFLIPPSLVFIIYGVIARVSIGQLWVAGIMPGALLATMYIIYIGVRCRRNPSLGPALPPEQRVGWGEKFRALGAGIGPIILIFAVLGLLFMGVTTLVECSVIGATGALILAAINKRLTRGLVREVMDNTTKVTTMIMWVFAGALLFAAVFDGLQAIDAIGNLLILAGGGPWGTLIMMQLSFFLLGMVLDDTALLIIVAPLYIPIAAHLGFSLVWFGVLYVVNMQMAFITPPFGYTLFILKGIAPKEITIGDIYRSAIPFVGIQATCLAIIMIFPQIALWLPSIVFGG